MGPIKQAYAYLLGGLDDVYVDAALIVDILSALGNITFLIEALTATTVFSLVVQGIYVTVRRILTNDFTAPRSRFLPLPVFLAVMGLAGLAVVPGPWHPTPDGIPLLAVLSPVLFWWAAAWPPIAVRLILGPHSRSVSARRYRILRKRDTRNKTPGRQQFILPELFLFGRKKALAALIRTLSSERQGRRQLRTLLAQALPWGCLGIAAAIIGSGWPAVVIWAVGAGVCGRFYGRVGRYIYERENRNKRDTFLIVEPVK